MDVTGSYGCFCCCSEARTTNDLMEVYLGEGSEQPCVRERKQDNSQEVCDANQALLRKKVVQVLKQQ